MIVRSRQQVLKTNPLDDENGLSAWWEFGPFRTGTSGRDAVVDLTGLGNYGTVSAGNPPQLSDGFTGFNALKWSPANNVGVVSLQSDVAATCLLFWYNPVTAANDTIFSNAAVTNTFQTNVSSKWLIFDGTNRTFTNGPVTGSWHHYAFNYTGSSYDLYQDGLFLETQNSNQISVGKFGRATANSSIDGSLASVKIFKIALSAAEIHAQYASYLTVLETEPDEWQMPILKKSSSAFPWWAVRNNDFVVGTGVQ